MLGSGRANSIRARSVKAPLKGRIYDSSPVPNSNAIDAVTLLILPVGPYMTAYAQNDGNDGE
jgi:hypothetical protein